MLAAPGARAALALVAVALSGALLLEIAGFDSLEAGRALVRGAFGGAAALSVTATRAVPLAVAGLAVALAFKAGVWNIGAEGQIYAGGAAAVSVGLAMGDVVSAQPALAVLGIPVALAAAAAAGAAWAYLPANLRTRRGVNEVVATILLNFIAIHLVAYLVSGPLQEGRGVFPQSDALDPPLRLPALIPGTRVHLGVLIALFLGFALWALRRTRPGFRVEAVGTAPRVAESVGMIDVKALRRRVFLISGGIAGVAGGVEIFGVTYALYSGFSPGWGYTAVAVAILGGLHPLRVLVAATLLGALEAGGAAMQREAGVPSAWVSVVVAMIIVAAVAGEALGRRVDRRGRARRSPSTTGEATTGNSKLPVG